ncbi:MAG TPA: ImmA/IrrE family metallo-endopeptidase [Gemmataceae bacterium]|jgi:hypothetical protein
MTNEAIGQTVADLRRDLRMPVDPEQRGPVSLERFFKGMNFGILHTALPKLSLRVVVEHLIIERWVADPESLGDLASSTDHLDGFLFWSADVGLAFVDADDILARRRFTAAHELGHAVLHRDRMGRYRTDSSIDVTSESVDPIEREANRFAAELLMPEEVIHARASELKSSYGACPRMVLAYRLASELLVSREAMRYRLKGLGVGHD